MVMLLSNTVDGVPSYSAVKVPVCDGNDVLIQAPAPVAPPVAVLQVEALGWADACAEGPLSVPFVAVTT
jgi:hypothetical protein